MIHSDSYWEKLLIFLLLSRQTRIMEIQMQILWNSLMSVLLFSYRIYKWLCVMQNVCLKLFYFEIIIKNFVNTQFFFFILNFIWRIVGNVFHKILNSFSTSFFQNKLLDFFGKGFLNGIKNVNTIFFFFKLRNKNKGIKPTRWGFLKYLKTSFRSQKWE